MRWPGWIDPADPRLSDRTNRVRVVTFCGRARRLNELAAEHGLTASCVRYRLDALRWPVEVALTTPRGAKPPADLVRVPRPPRQPVPIVNGRKRRCPALRHHKGLGQAYVGYKIQSRRRVVYLGPWGSPTARARYNAFCRKWPSQLLEPEPPRGGNWPVARMLTHDGMTQTVTRWAEETGIKATTIRFRLDVKGWGVARALTTPVKPWTRKTAPPT